MAVLRGFGLSFYILLGLGKAQGFWGAQGSGFWVSGLALLAMHGKSSGKHDGHC